MKAFFVAIFLVVASIYSYDLSAQSSKSVPSDYMPATKHLFIDVHQLEPGKVTYKAAADAHAKDLAVQGKYGVEFRKFWVDEQKGLIYCLASSADTQSIRKAHSEAHGLLPDHIYSVTDGPEANSKGQDFFLDVHVLGAGKVSAKDAAGAHDKDLAVQSKHGVNFVNYWVDEKEGVVMCLSQAKDSTSIIQAHKEAHGLLPAYVLKVKQGK
jgi:Nickel responsive protein SCO4226-like